MVEFSRAEISRVGTGGFSSPEFGASPGIVGFLSSGISGFLSRGIGGFSKPRSSDILFCIGSLGVELGMVVSHCVGAVRRASALNC